MPPARGERAAYPDGAGRGWGPRCGSVLEVALAGRGDLVDEAVLLGLLGGQDLVALDVVADLLGRAAGVLGPGLLEPGAHALHLVGLDLDVGRLATHATLEGRLVDQDPRVRQGEPLAL